MNWKREKGTLLLEIIICAVIIALVGVGILGTLAFNRKFTVTTRHKIEALNFARQKIEEFKHTHYDAIIAGSDANITFTDGVSATRTWTVTDIYWDADENPDAKEVTVTINWDE